MSQFLDAVLTRPAKRLNSRQVTFLVFVGCLHALPLVALFTGVRLVDGFVCVGF